MSFITKRRLASLVPASAILATAVVATAPGATLAAETCQPTGFVRDGINLTAARMGGTVTGTVNAAGCNIAVYIDATHPGSVTNADISGTDYYGVVVNGVAANVTGSKVHRIGDSPFDGMQHGNAILYINGASGTISGNSVYDFQKNGITVSGKDANNNVISKPTTSASVTNNTVTGEGPIDYIAQNGIQISFGASATVNKNVVSGFWYTPVTDEACGLLLYQAGRVNVQNNTISPLTNETPIYPDAGSGHIKP
jgi:hypothetical protein